MYALAGARGGLEHAVGDGARGVAGGDGAVYAGGEDEGLGERRFALPAEFAVFGGTDLGRLGGFVENVLESVNMWLYACMVERVEVTRNPLQRISRNPKPNRRNRYSPHTTAVHPPIS